MIKTQKVGYRTGKQTLIHEFTQSFAQGKVTVLAGPNGAGKSTLIRLLAGLLPPSTGDITLAGQSLRAWSNSALAAVRAYLPQSHALSFPMSVAEVLKLGQVEGTPLSMEDAQNAKARLLSTFALEALAQRSYTSLSGGEQQRVQLARVLFQLAHLKRGQDGLLLLDEPLNGLDLKHQQAVLQAIHARARQGQTCILALHDLNVAAEIADELIFLKKGVVVASGPVDSVFTGDILETVFEVKVQLLNRGAQLPPYAHLPMGINQGEPSLLSP